MPDNTNPLKAENIEKELRSARKKLLDLTMHNRLLNFRPSKARTIKVINEDPSGVYDVLVIQEKSMQFQAKTLNSGYKSPPENNPSGPLPDARSEDSGPGADDASNLWKSPPAAELPDSQTDTLLQTALETDDLQQRLFYIYQDSKSVLEELGYSTLYMATAFLAWTETNTSTETRLAPLLLIPVELERSGVRSAFRLKWNSEDISTNISLKEILLQQDIKLPDFEMPDIRAGINDYLQKVTASIQSRPNWHILKDTSLGFFSFTKFIMYKDIDPGAWPEGSSPVEHPLIKAIFGSSGEPILDSGFQENEVDQKLKSFNLFHVLDADPSQIAIIEDVKAGRNLAVEGPPGTGKSQTIVNIIAELMAAGKSVLFVSEKMAALEVVKDRLDNVGLGDFCLELHSRKSNKKEFLANLERTLYGAAPRPAPSGNDYDELESLKLELDRYAEDLGTPFGKIQLSPYVFFHQKESARCYFEKLSKSMPRIRLGNIGTCGNQDYEEARRKLRELQGILPMIAPVSGHPWFGCSPAVILPSHEETIGELLNNCLAESGNLQTVIDKLVELCGIRPAQFIAEIPPIMEAAKVMAASRPVSQSVLMNSNWDRPNQNADNLVSKLTEFQGIRRQVLGKFKNEVTNPDIDALLEPFEKLSGQFFKIFNGKYRRLKRQILLLYQKPLRKSDGLIIADLKELKQYQSRRKAIQGYQAEGQNLFGPYWQGEETDPEILRSFSAWIISFRQCLAAKYLSAGAVDIVSRGVSPESIKRAVEELDRSGKNLSQLLETLAGQVGADYEIIFGQKIAAVNLPELVSRLRLWQSALNKLQLWSQYIALRQQCTPGLAGPLVPAIEKDIVNADDLLPCFEGNFADDMLAAIFVERPALANFIGTLHEHKIKRFADLDRKTILLNRQKLVQKLLQVRPSFYEGASSGSEIGILRGEFNRKRGHMPIRKLMSQVGGLIQKIKPCFMMSPLSIAQFLDPKTTRFDVVVYDEASQVRPEDALGALLRGKQATVIGDTRQLPPTTFFDRLIEDTPEEDTAADSSHIETESILHQCRTCFPVKMLRWHYRSKHESLVAVSNKEFYDNRLLLYPSPVQESEDLGLHLIYLPATIYDRGAGQTNRQEAKIIAEKAVEHYQKHPQKSLGIGAFNVNQQQAILEEVELQLRRHPEMEQYFQSDRFEHFFVKNLETIQGDERDVIFISVGYGFDKFKKLTLNFGPLNNVGGERRLNVLITRAREKCAVFSNFKAPDLRLDAGAPWGLRALKLFLNFAENHVLEANPADRENESLFEDSVYEFVRESGYTVTQHVGCAGFRVDLAIADRAAKGNFLLGIECDGAKYHRSPVARDRDRLRQQILESLGWSIYRIWSTDWYRNRRECQQRLLEAVEKRLKENDINTKPPVPVELPAPAETTEASGTEIIRNAAGECL